MSDETLYNTQAAGDWLHAAIPDETSAHWRHALINNRRTDRNPAYRIPFATMGRAAFYKLDDLKAFADFERSRRVGTMKLSARAAEALRAVGFNEKGGSSTGRRFDVASISHQIDDATGEAFIQLVLTNPHLLVYRLPISQALEIADSLRGEASGNRTERNYSTVVDNSDVLIKRGKKP